MALADRIKEREKELVSTMPSPRVARFTAARQVTAEAIAEASTLEDMREILAAMHQKIYS